MIYALMGCLELSAQYNNSPLFNGSSFDQRQLITDTTQFYYVGTLGGEASVSLSGIAQYHIPIELPIGTNGQVPELSINYMHLGGDGILGQGWSLSGLSRITRCNKDMARDGVVAPITLAGSDGFMLDGNRLIYDSNVTNPNTGLATTYGGPGSTYYTHAESFSRIRAWGNISGGPEYFLVESKGGSLLTYGGSINSRVMDETGTKVIMWLISKAQDKYGNYISYEYINTAGNEPLISKIYYSGNANANPVLNPYYVINFVYQLRVDQNFQYISGSKLASKYLLTEIRLGYQENSTTPPFNGTDFKRYYLQYYEDDMHSYLRQIEVEARDGANAMRFNPTIFKYGENPSGLISQSYNLNSTIPITGHRHFSGDFNGDGFTDIIASEKASAPNEYASLNMKLYTNNGGTGNNFTYRCTQVLNSSSFVFQNMDMRTKANYMIGDYNGDGADDILVAEENFTTLQAIKIFYFNSVNNSFSVLTYNQDYVNPVTQGIHNRFSIYNGQYLYPGDFDGDNATDFLTFLSDGGSYRAFITFPRLGINHKWISNVGLGYEFDVSALYSPYSNIVKKGYVFDYDGDGKDEYMITSEDPNNNSANIFTFNLNATATTLTTAIISTTGYPTSWHSIFPGDFNGDGKTDILTHSPDFGWSVGYSRGKTGFFETSFNFSIPVTPDDDGTIDVNNLFYDNDIGNRIWISDQNGDGKSDILLYYMKVENYTPISKIESYISVGPGSTNTFYTTIQNINSWTYPGLPNPDFARIAGDFNADGRLDITDLNSRWVYFNKLSENHYLTRIKNGLNHESIFDYNYLTHNELAQDASINAIPFYTKSETESYPLQCVSLPLPVVDLFKLPNASASGTSQNWQIFKYENAKIHLRGNGFMGFKKVHEQVHYGDDWNNTPIGGYKKTTELGINTVFYQSYPYKIYLKKYTDNSLLSTEENTFDFVSLSGNKRFLQKLIKTKTTDHISNSIDRIEYTYDSNSFGNIASEIRYTDTNDATVAPTYREKTQTTATYVYNGAWIPSAPDLITTTVTRNGEAAVSKVVDYNYVNNKLDYVKEFSNKTKWFKTSYTNYNGFGIPLTVTVSGGPSLTANITDYIYDIKGRFPTAITSNNLISIRTYIGKWGVLDQTTNEQNITQKYSYDIFGRKIQVRTTLPDQTSTFVRSQLAWENPNTGILQSGSEDLNPTNFIYKITTTAGNSQNTNKPSPDKVEYYDLLGRVRLQKIKGFDGAWIKSVYTYNKRGDLVKTTTPFTSSTNAIITKSKYDELNRLVSQTNGEFNHTFSYSIVNTPVKSVKATKTTLLPSAEGGNRTTYLITDMAGKTIETSDDGGIVNFQYDSWGNIREIKVNGTITSSSVYDEYNRQSSLWDCNTGTTTYNYNAYDQLISQTDALNNTVTMTYDNMGRLDTRVGSEGTTDYQYISSGNGINMLDKIIGFDNTTQDLSYNSNHQLIEDKWTLGTDNYVTTYTYDENRRIQITTYPSLIAVRNEFDANGYLWKIRNGNSSTSSVLYTTQKVDAFGHYKQYQNGNSLISETSYDNYGFPTKIKCGTIQELNLNISKKSGNLLSRVDVLTNQTESFTYDQLDRLTTSTINNNNKSITYHSQGNINTKWDVGTYTYDAAKINAVNSVDGAGFTNTTNPITTLKSGVTYNSFQQPSYISQYISDPGPGLPGTSLYNLTLTYGHDYQRIKTIFKQDNNILSTKYFFRNYEKEITGSGASQVTRHVHYVSAPSGMVAMIVKEVTSTSSTTSSYFVHSDQLGSILRVSNSSGTIVADQNFDAWGRYRSTTNWNTYLSSPPTTLPAWLWRGYTGHEMLPHLKMINMNGRLYDPIVGRMLSPDNFVQDPMSTQSHNRYTYALNNPLKYRDPSGEWALFDDVAAILLGGIINVAVNWKTINAGGKFNWGKAALAFGIGAAAGEASLYAGAAGAGLATGANAVLLGAAAGAAAGVSGGFITGAGNAWMNGASFKQGLKQGGIGAAFGLGMGAVGGAAGGWFSTTPAGQKVGSWMGKHSKGRFFDRKNPNSPFSPDKKLFGKNKGRSINTNKVSDGEVEVGELEATQFGDNPSVYYDEGKIRNKLLDHGYRDNRLDHLGLSEEDFLDKAMKHLALNRALLVEGNNTWVGLINNSPVTFRLYVENGILFSYNAFAGHSNRVLVGSFTNFGNLFW